MDKREYLPSYLMNSQIFRDVYNLNMGEVADYHKAIDDLTAQAYIETATWGLKYWESFLGIPVDETKVSEERRSVIKSKLRGHGTATMELMKVVANAYENGQVLLLENVRNRIPSLQTASVWSLHSNAHMLEGYDYGLRLDATVSDQKSYVTIKGIPKINYVFTGYVNDRNASYVFEFWDEQNSLINVLAPEHIPGINTFEFVTPDKTDRIRIYLTNQAAGQFIFRDFILTEGKQVEQFRPYLPYTFTVQFVGEKGTPPNLDDLKEAIQRIKPAHLDVIYKFRFLLIKEVHGMIIDEMKDKKIELFAGGGDQ